MKCRIELVGGPMDGHIGWADLVDQPGKFAMYVHRTRSQKYVYQARRFTDDHCEMDDGPLPMDFVQIIDLKEEP